ncbi:hypothetical protein [Lentibacillus sp. Marseille-P4043]|uniref:hypothetical protein n=1 Tax=Lentibacillus sp. Marseille-P4043 TaxID=2040293 RepID=UPI00131A5F5D|nr:hypothetical protein [Lentibacillus sp. Marseille-P4043]
MKSFDYYSFLAAGTNVIIFPLGYVPFHPPCLWGNKVFCGCCLRATTTKHLVPEKGWGKTKVKDLTMKTLVTVDFVITFKK